MRNKDEIKQKKMEAAQALASAMKGGDEQKIQEAFVAFSTITEEGIRAEAAEAMSIENHDTTVLASRGVRMLTSAEIKAYTDLGNSVVAAAQSGAPTNWEVTLPETVIDAVMDDIRRAHPLLDEITFMNTHGAIKMLVNKKGAQTAVWGKITSAIAAELEGAFDAVDTMLLKLSAYMPISKDLVELGPTWMDAYVRATLSEAVALGLEVGIVDGDGKEKPIGMTRDVSDTANVQGGVYPRMTAVKLTSLEAEELNRVDDALKLDPGNTDLLAEKQKLLAESIENTKNKLQLLKESQEQITQQYAAGDIDRGAYLEFQQELADTKQKLKELQQAQKDFGTVAQQVMEQAGAKVSEYGEKMSTAGNRMLPATAAIGALGALAVNSGSDLIESQNKVDVAFGESSQIIEDFADTTLETYGIAKGTALDMAALFGDMGTSMGLTDSEAANLAQGLVGLSGDLASFKNIGVEDAQNALKGIFTGETESLKTLGIVMNETTLLQQAIKEGFVSDQKTAQQLAKEQINLEKAQAAYNEAVKKYGSDSLQAREAQLKLDEAQAATNESANG